MTKTVCDICEHKTNNQYTIPIWSSFNTDEFGNTIPNYAEIKRIQIDLCEKCEKRNC